MVSTLLAGTRSAQRSPRGNDSMRPLRECSDEDLLSRVIAASDRAAFAVLVERDEAMALRVCMRVLHQRQVAEAARQETFLVLWQKADSIQDRGRIGSWLHGVAHRKAMRIRKRRQRRKKHETYCGSGERIAQITQITQQFMRWCFERCKLFCGRNCSAYLRKFEYRSYCVT
jgi:hypothetical protein